MAEKTTKKTSVKKTVAKPATAKKVVAKKATVKKVADIKKVATAPVAEKYSCGCDKGCPCGGDCTCAKKKCTFGRFLKKLILFFVIFALGFAAAKMCCCDKRGKFGPRPEFENGCLVVKCPKMVEKMAQIDINNDGCVDKSEFKAFKREMRKPAPAPVETAAPVAE